MKRNLILFIYLLLNSIAIHAASGFTANVPLNGSSTVSMTFSIRSQNADMTGTVSVGQYNFMQLFLGVPVVDSVSTVGTVTIDRKSTRLNSSHL